jgi:ParB family transcriptional regulator, chromosome partitioning protein
MGRLDEMRRTAGGNVAESASRREAPVLAATPQPGLNPARMEGVARSKAALEIPIEKIERDPAQPREEFDPEALARLAGSIAARGLLQPVRVRWSEEQGRYILIAGERRWRAAGMAGLKALTCIVEDREIPPAELLAIQVTENALREDLNPMERARAFRTLMDLNGWSGNQLAKELGISQSGVVQALALLELPSPVQDLVDRGELAPTVGYEASKLDDPDAQQELVDRAVAEGMSRSQVIEARREIAGRSTQGGRTKGRGAKAKPRKETSRTLKTSAGKVTVENRRGLDDKTMVVALREAADQIEAAQEGRGAAAA